LFSNENADPQTVETVKSSANELKPLSMVKEDHSKIQGIALKLRRAKRSLLLSAASAEQHPVSPVEQFRTIIMHLSDLDLDHLSLPTDASSSSSGGSSVCIYNRARAGSVTSSGSK
jgi:hypothetical protein